jgi:hypothetical protein
MRRGPAGRIEIVSMLSISSKTQATPGSRRRIAQDRFDISDADERTVRQLCRPSHILGDFWIAGTATAAILFYLHRQPQHGGTKPR